MWGKQHWSLLNHSFASSEAQIWKREGFLHLVCGWKFKNLIFSLLLDLPSKISESGVLDWWVDAKSFSYCSRCVVLTVVMPDFCQGWSWASSCLAWSLCCGFGLVIFGLISFVLFYFLPLIPERICICLAFCSAFVNLDSSFEMEGGYFNSSPDS